MPWHLKEIKVRQFEILTNLVNDELQANILYHGGPGFTGIYNDKIVVSAGLVIKWRGVAQAWMVIGNESPIKSIYKSVKQGLISLIESCNLHRIEAKTQANFNGGVNWLRHLGFEFESMKRSYGPDGADYVEYSMVR